MGTAEYIILYAASDAAFAKRLAADLKQAGFSIDYIEFDLIRGTADQPLSRNLEQATGLIVVLNAVTNQEAITQRDFVKYAYFYNRKIILAVLQPSELHSTLRLLTSIDFTKAYDTAFQQLLLKIKTIKEPPVILLESRSVDPLPDVIKEALPAPEIREPPVIIPDEPRLSAPPPSPRYSPVDSAPPAPRSAPSIGGWLSRLFGKKKRKQEPLPPTGGSVLENMDRALVEADIVPKHPADEVSCSVFASSAALPGESLMVQVFAHPPKEIEQVHRLAALYDEKAKARGSKLLEEKVARGTKLTFHLSMPGVEVDETTQHLKWQGETASVQFGVYVPADHKGGTVIGTVYVSSESIPFGHVKFILQIGATTENIPLSKQHTTDSWKRYQYAFISYASADRAEVLKRVQMLPRFHIQYFQDLLTLEPGMRWEKELYKEINKCDVFFLFWSTAAKNSQWVLQEVQYAIQRKKDDLDPPEIVPIIIEGPPPVAPPTELQHLHFNDAFIYFMNVKEK